MKSTFIGALALGLIAGLGTAHAQSDEKPVPKAPYINPVPDYGHWIVTFKYAPSAPSGPAPASPSPATPAPGATAPATPEPVQPPTGQSGPPKSIETIKTGDLRGITVMAFDGSTREFTCQGNWILSSTAQGAQLGIISPVSHPYAYFSTGYILLDKAKIDLSTFVGVVKHNGVQAFHYKSVDEDVWIDPQTMYPMGAKQEDVEVSYQFLTPPPRPFPIPKDQESLLRKEQAAAQATSTMR